jgi:hypothetical protein
MVMGILNCPPPKKSAQQIGQGRCYLVAPAAEEQYSVSLVRGFVQLVSAIHFR